MVYPRNFSIRLNSPWNRTCACNHSKKKKFFRNTENCLWIKPSDALNSNFIGITTLHVSDRLSAHHQEFLAVYQHWYILCRLMTICYQE